MPKIYRMIIGLLRERIRHECRVVGNNAAANQAAAFSEITDTRWNVIGGSCRLVPRLCQILSAF